MPTTTIVLFTLTVMFPVASLGTVMLIIATSPTVMLFTATVIFEGTLDTFNVVELVLGKYCSSPM